MLEREKRITDLWSEWRQNLAGLLLMPGEEKEERGFQLKIKKEDSN